MVDAEGQIWTGVDDGRIVRDLDRRAVRSTVVGDTGGRPLVESARAARDRPATWAAATGPAPAGRRRHDRPARSRHGRRRLPVLLATVTRNADGTNLFHGVDRGGVHLRRLHGARFWRHVGRGSLFRRDPDGTVLTLVPGCTSRLTAATGRALVLAESQAAGSVGTARDGHTLPSTCPACRTTCRPVPTAASGARSSQRPTRCGPAGERIAADAQAALAAAAAVAAEAGIGRLGRRVRPRHRGCGRGPADRAPRASAKSPAWSRRTARCG